MIRSFCRILSRAVRPAIAVVLVFAQVVTAFGFPLVQTQKTIKACGCITPCGAESDNCCCAKAPPVAAPEPKKPGCPKCRDREAPAESAVVWVAGFKARQCRGESPMGLLAELPALPPVVASPPFAAPVCTELTRLGNTHLNSHFTIPRDPPPRHV